LDLSLGVGFSTFLPTIVVQSSAHSCISVMLQVADKQVFKNEGLLANL